MSAVRRSRASDPSASATILRAMIAHQFASLMVTWFGKAKIAEVERRNAAYEAEGKTCCSSHEFCDAHVIMIDAFTAVMGRGPTLPDDETEEQQAVQESDFAHIDAMPASASISATGVGDTPIDLRRCDRQGPGQGPAHGG